jgi:cytochrome c2
MRKPIVFLILVLLLGLVACGGDSGGEGAASGDATAGQEVFEQVAAPACNTCHSLQPGEDLVGPSLAGIGTEAGNRVSGQSAQEYLRASIVAPDDHIVEGYSANIMPTSYGTQLTDQQITDLVAYLLSLK